MILKEGVIKGVSGKKPGPAKSYSNKKKGVGKGNILVFHCLWVVQVTKNHKKH